MLCLRIGRSQLLGGAGFGVFAAAAAPGAPQSLWRLTRHWQLLQRQELESCEEAVAPGAPQTLALARRPASIRTLLDVRSLIHHMREYERPVLGSVMTQCMKEGGAGGAKMIQQTCE